MKYVSSKHIVSRVMRDFKIKQISNHLYDIYQWIGDAVEMIGTTAPLIAKSTRNEGEVGALTVKSHRVALPYDYVEHFAVEYKGKNLPFGMDKSGFGLPTTPRSTDVSQAVSRYGYLTYEDGTPVTEQDFAHLPYYTGEYYVLNADYIQTSFEEGHIKLHYLGLYLDDCGLPMIENQPKYKAAITWYVISMLLLQGFKHPVLDWQTANFKWEEFLPMAQNEIIAPTLYKMETFRNMWVRVIPKISLADDFFMNGEIREMVDI